MTNICAGDFSVDQIRSAIVLAVGYDIADASAFLSASGEVVSKAELCARFNDALQHVDPDAKAVFWEKLTRYASMGLLGASMGLMAAVGYKQYNSIYHWKDMKKGYQNMLFWGLPLSDKLIKSIHNTSQIGYLSSAAALGLIASFFLSNRNLQQNSVKKLEEMDAKALLVANAVDIDDVPTFAKELCNDAQFQTRTSSYEFRSAMMKAAQKHGVKLKYRHFFKPDGSLRNEKDVCTMVKAVPPLRASLSRKSSKQHHRGGKGRGSRRSVSGARRRSLRSF
jgi:hypothetical protein